MIWIFLGAPGSGKGTQAQLLSKDIGIPHVSTGELLRKAVDEGTELGKKAQSYMRAGELVPDELILGMVREALKAGTAGEGCILDGYPRNTAQAEALEGMLEEIGLTIAGALNLEVAEDALVRRIKKRATDEGRADDTEDTVRNRLRVYDEQTAPLVEYYRERGLLKPIAGEGTIEEIQARIRAIITARSSEGVGRENGTGGARR